MVEGRRCKKVSRLCLLDAEKVAQGARLKAKDSLFSLLALRREPYTLYPIPYTFYPRPYTFYLKPFIASIQYPVSSIQLQMVGG